MAGGHLSMLLAASFLDLSSMLLITITHGQAQLKSVFEPVLHEALADVVTKDVSMAH